MANARVDRIRELGYRIGWAQGATPDDLRDKHREAGWAWEGDTHAQHDGEPIQHDDANAPGYVPEHRVLRDDSDQPTIWFVEGPADGGEVGDPTGYEQQDGVPVAPFVRIYVTDDDDEAWQTLLDSYDDMRAEIDLLVAETSEETSERHQREAEERAAEDA